MKLYENEAKHESVRLWFRDNPEVSKNFLKTLPY